MIILECISVLFELARWVQVVIRNCEGRRYVRVDKLKFVDHK
jgi:hypothetical protein